MRNDSPEVNGINPVFSEMDNYERAQLRQEIAGELGSVVAERMGLAPQENSALEFVESELQKLAAPQEKPAGADLSIASETRRSDRFKRDRFKDEAEAELESTRLDQPKSLKRAKILDKRKNNIKSKQQQLA